MSPAEIPQFDPEKEKAALGLNQQKVEEDSDIENKGEESEEKIDQKETIEITEADFKNEEVLQEKIKNFTPEKYLNFTKKFSGFYKKDDLTQESVDEFLRKTLELHSNLETSKHSEYSKLLELRNLEKAPTTSSQRIEIQENLMSNKILSGAEKFLSPGRFDLIGKGGGKGEKELINDKSLHSIKKFIINDKYKEKAIDFFNSQYNYNNILRCDGFNLGKMETFFDFAKDITPIKDPELIEVKLNILSLIPFEIEEFNTYIKKYVRNSHNLEETGKLIDLLQECHLYIEEKEEEDYSCEEDIFILRTFREIKNLQPIAKNYFLNSKLEKFINEFKSYDSLSDSELRKVAKEISSFTPLFQSYEYGDKSGKVDFDLLSREEIIKIIEELPYNYSIITPFIRMEKFFEMKSQLESIDYRKIYDLNELGPMIHDTIVIKIAPSKIGIFDRQGELIKYFDETQVEKGRKIKPELKDISEYDAFIIREDVTPEEREQNLLNLKDFLYLTSVSMRERVEKDFGIDLSEFDFRIQNYFLNFLKSKSEKEMQEVVEFTKKFGKDAFRTFLSLEYGEENGDKVLELANDYPEVAKEIFKGYSNILNLAQKCVNKYEDKLSSGELNLVHEGIIRKAKELLLGSLDYYKELEQKKKIGFTEENFVLSSLGITPKKAIESYEVYLEAYFGFPKGVEELKKIAAKFQEDEKVILYLFDIYKGNSDMSSLPGVFLESIYLNQILKEKESKVPSSEEVKEKFYQEYEEMNKDASETTGDTLRERIRLYNFIKKLGVKGRILDAGCGDGIRMTEPLASFLKRENIPAEIIAIDLLQKDHKSKFGVDYRKANITNMKDVVPNKSVDVVVNNWSVVNDLLKREEQVNMFREFNRVLKKGGILYLDVPWLEGGKGSWKEKADEYHKRHLEEAYGAIEVDFPSKERIGKSKFFIYPYDQLVKFLVENGFEILNPIEKFKGSFAATQLGHFHYMENDSLKNPAWRTHAKISKPRVTIIARKTGELSSTLTSRVGIISPEKPA